MIVHPPRFAAIGIIIAIAALTLSIFQSTGATAAEKRATVIEMELSESFYRELRNEGTRTYTTDKSEEYLRRVAVSSRFSMEANLKIIEQQAKIIELLEAIKKQGN